MTNITVNNQRPSEIPSFNLGSIGGAFSPFETARDHAVQKLFTPLMPGQPATIEKDGTPLTADDITMEIFDCCSETVDPDKEDLVKDIFARTLSHYEKALSVQDVFAVQAGKKNQLLMPSARVLYTPTDVIDAAKQFLAGQLGPDSFFATLAFYARVQAFGYYFANDAAFTAFKNFFAAQVATVQGLLGQDTIDLCASFQKLSLNKLTEGLVVRDDETQNNDPYSFARILPFYLMMYEQQRQGNGLPVYACGHMPFSLSDNFCPRAIILVNVERHAHAHPNEIKQEWDIIRNAMVMKPKVLGNNQIAKLTSVARMAAKMRAQAVARQNAQSMRSAIIRFRKTAPTSVELYKYIVTIYKRTQFVQQSENAVKTVRMTYNRPSRREPDNPDRQGKATALIFRPDLHIYLDCSGSISERQYQDAIKAIIRLAKKMGVNLYFNSFSHIMSEATRLPVKGRTIRQVYDAFKNIPKVGGGTDYEQIWHYINQTQRRRKEVSIVISDFEWSAPNHYVEHPRFLYYAPISATSWSTITKMAERFAKSMLNICPGIRKHILM